jgi:hypothetical protein
VSGPASIWGAIVYVIVIELLAALHCPLPVVVKVIVTLLAAVSAELGVYVAFIVVLFGLKVPVPELDHIAPLAIVNEPFNTTFALLEHTEAFDPAFAVGAWVKLTTNWSDTGLHVPLFVLANVSVTLPVVVSALLGKYVAFNVVLSGVNVPVPLVLHCPDPVADVPFSEIASLFAQTVTSDPAFTFGIGVYVTVIDLVTGIQVPLLPEVKVNVTLPAAVSALLAMYVAFNVFAFGENAPVPVVFHTPEPVLDEPLSNTFALFLHTDTLLPAFTLGACVMVIFITSETTAHCPLPVLVNVSVTLPDAVSAELGVYVAFIVVLFGVNTPLPEVDHIAPVEVVNEPFNVTTSLLPQTVWSGPAFT